MLLLVRLCLLSTCMCMNVCVVCIGCVCVWGGGGVKFLFGYTIRDSYLAHLLQHKPSPVLNKFSKINLP